MRATSETVSSGCIGVVSCCVIVCRVSLYSSEGTLDISGFIALLRLLLVLLLPPGGISGLPRLFPLANLPLVLVGEVALQHRIALDGLAAHQVDRHIWCGLQNPGPRRFPSLDLVRISNGKHLGQRRCPAALFHHVQEGARQPARIGACIDVEAGGPSAVEAGGPSAVEAGGPSAVEAGGPSAVVQQPS